MEKRLMRTKGMSSMKYGTSSQYFTIVLHHGGSMVNSPRFRYSGNKSRGSLNVKHLRTDCDILLMLNAMPRNRQLHVFLEEEVVALEPPVETTRNDSDQPDRTETN
ncbi:hypothetical protein V6N13_099227 [Hibiscus sabdariffa]